MNDEQDTTNPTPAVPAEAWVLVMIPLASDVPAAVRMRRWLKAGLRAHGLRCVRVSDRLPEPVIIEVTKNHRRKRAVASGSTIGGPVAGESTPTLDPAAGR